MSSLRDALLALLTIDPIVGGLMEQMISPPFTCPSDPVVLRIRINQTSQVSMTLILFLFFYHNALFVLTSSPIPLSHRCSTAQTGSDPARLTAPHRSRRTTCMAVHQPQTVRDIASLHTRYSTRSARRAWPRASRALACAPSMSSFAIVRTRERFVTRTGREASWRLPGV